MADAFKCRNCGTVVDSPQNCPDCGESAMSPVSRGDVTEEQSATEGDDDTSDVSEHTAAAEGSDDTSSTADHTAARETETREESTDSGGLLYKLKSLFS